jgi:hypothetical protein
MLCDFENMIAKMMTRRRGGQNHEASQGVRISESDDKMREK